MIHQHEESAVIPSFELSPAVSEADIIDALPDEAVFREEKRHDEARKRQRIDQIGDEARHHLKRYYDAILELMHTIRERIDAKYPCAQILEFRTPVLPFSGGLSLLVVFDAIDLETDLHIGLILSEIEEHFLIERKMPCEIDYMRKARYIDGTMMNKRYPFIVQE